MREADVKSNEPQPSSEVELPWIGDVGPKPPRSESAGGIGKWLLFVNRADVDEVWMRIRQALRSGKLGHAAKVSTAAPSPFARRPGKHVIVVYTDDTNDEADVMKVRAALRDLGFAAKITYKEDTATRRGQYEERGKRVSKYFL